MFGLGMGELMVILAVALLVLGPKRLPDLASGMGKAIRDFRKATRDLKDQIEIDESVRRPLQELKSALRDEPIPWASRTPIVARAASPDTSPKEPCELSSTGASCDGPSPSASCEVVSSKPAPDLPVEVLGPKDPVR